jgi:hypothetical protein
MREKKNKEREMAAGWRNKTFKNNIEKRRVVML